MGGDPVVQVRALGIDCRGPRMAFRLLHRFTRHRSTLIVYTIDQLFRFDTDNSHGLMVQSWQPRQLRNDESGGRQKQRENVHMMDRKDQLPSSPEL